MTRTYSAKPSDVTRSWYIIDAGSDTLGKVATAAAKLLLGKEKPQFTHHIDTGDFVIIINASRINVSGAKLQQKRYYRHSGFPGGLHSRTLAEQLERDPTQVMLHAVRGMLPNNKLLDARLKRLKIYAGSEHPHDPQKRVSISTKKGKTE